jgi:hypothetical protein
MTTISCSICSFTAYQGAVCDYNKNSQGSRVNLVMGLIFLPLL